MPSRRAISVEQKRALRAYKRANPSLSNINLRSWFYTTYKQQIALSSISEILSNRYAPLDNIPSEQPARAGQRRFRREHLPELEDALFQWIQHAEQHITISAETIREKAKFFWDRLEIYRDQEMPTFSNGWLQGFQRRRGIADRTKHSELASARTAVFEMNAIRQALASFQPQDIFNCDESGLFWKRVPDRSLSTRSLPGRRKEKVRITIHFCVNQDGSERLPLWVIGRSMTPRAFRAARINIQSLGAYWRNNKSAWMISTIMEEWLRWFDLRMTGRKVALLMDNFSAHEKAVANINTSARPLQNTLVIWLPANTTSKYQPLDQGIINTWKTLWRREWVRYMLREYDAQRDPLATIDILKAIRWGIRAWEFDLSDQTILNCFRKALYAESAPEDQAQASFAEIYNNVQRLQSINATREAMDIKQFLNPDDERLLIVLRASKTRFWLNSRIPKMEILKRRTQIM